MSQEELWDITKSFLWKLENLVEGVASSDIAAQLAALQKQFEAAKAAEAEAEAKAHPEKNVSDAVNEVEHLGRIGHNDMSVVGAALRAILEYVLASLEAKVEGSTNGQPATDEPSASSAG